MVLNTNGEQLAILNQAGILVAQLSTRAPTPVRIATVTVTLVSTADASPGCAFAAQAVVSGA